MTSTSSPTSVSQSDLLSLVTNQAKQIRELVKAIEARDHAIDSLQSDNRALKQALFRLGRTHVGPGETEGQLFLFGEEPRAAEPAPAEPNDPSKSKQKRNSTGRQVLPSSLKRVEAELKVDDAMLACDCGKKGCRRVVMGYEVAEAVEFVPAELFVKVTRRAKLVCPSGDNGVLTVAPEPRVIDKCLAGDSLLIFVAMQKFVYHMPLHRVAKMIKAQGWRVAESTLCGWIHMLADRLSPIVIAMKQWLLEQPYIQADETPAKARDPKKKGKHKQVYFWVYSLPWQEVIFDYQTGRSGEHARAFLADFDGNVLQVDEFSGYDAYFRLNPEKVRAGCWSHAIRKFKDAVKSVDWIVEATEIQEILSKLLKLETLMRKKERTDDERLRIRGRIHTPALATVKVLIDKALLNPKIEPKNSFGKAVRYCGNHWEALTTFLTRGNVEMDNNAIENAIRSLAIGRKNWMHIGHIDAGDTAAVFYTIMGSSQRLGLNTQEYLTDVFRRLPTQPPERMHELTPRGWRNAQAQGDTLQGDST